MFSPNQSENRPSSHDQPWQLRPRLGPGLRPKLYHGDSARRHRRLCRDHRLIHHDAVARNRSGRTAITSPDLSCTM
ncbi:hypothetical protein TorRG33x02_166220 [Trema orientale]|uniref:Uncharacterized protein n=1 Tax=Trema orientale TaxID=63057 RepID=A0A2P5EQ32_TREOI|nr:hypothetical protein TorRG33x02_166220 [Trema orientale]